MHYPMKVVVHKTGLRSETLRAWERRYSGIRPERDSKGRRVYSDELLEKLVLLSILVDQGCRIGSIANERIEDLRLQVDQLSGQTPQQICPEPSSTAACDSAITFDDTGVWLELERAALAYGRLEMIDGFVFPLLRDIQRLQAAGSAQEVHSRFAVTCIRTFLSTMSIPAPNNSQKPTVVIACPIGQSSAVGGIASTNYARAAGWHPIFLGDSVPSDQIVATVNSVKADAIVIAATTEYYHAGILSELVRMRRGVGSECPIYFGGKMPERLRADIVSAGLCHVRRMCNLRENLESLRTDTDTEAALMLASERA